MKLAVAVLFTFLLVGVCCGAEQPAEKENVSTLDPELRDLLGGEKKTQNATESNSSVTNSTTAPEPPPSSTNKTTTSTTEKAKKADDDDGPNLMDDDDDGESKASEDTSKANDTDTAVFLPKEGSAEEEKSSSRSIFFLLSVIGLCILLVHVMLQFKCHYLPESLAIVFLGAVIGLFIRLLPNDSIKSVESFSPTMFFLVLLPPIIFESGYNLHKGNFFANIGSIALFAVFGTIISAIVVGGGVYLLGLAGLVYKLNFVQSFAFGSLISAVDPVATLAIFQAIDVDPILNMLVFGESILNDAVAIVLTTTVMESVSPGMADMSALSQLGHGVGRFFAIFFGSAAIGTLMGLGSSLVLKYIDLYNNPSLEFALMLCFVYSPYALAEGIHLSGIMSILFCAIVMSQYTHYNLSPVTQITMQQTMRTISFISESCIFAYLGLALFSFPLRWEPALIIWSIIFILFGRALNIFPLSVLCNKFRQHQITKKMMLIMWFSGLRGAIAYALCLHLEFNDDVRRVLVTTTLVIVLFTTIGLGGGTMPLMKYLARKVPPKNRRGRRKKEITLSKTRELGATIDSEQLSEMTETEGELESGGGTGGGSGSGTDVNGEVRADDWSTYGRVKSFLYYDLTYFRPFFTRRFTQRELREGRSHVTRLTDKWIENLQGSPLVLSESEEEFNQQHD